MCSKQRFALLLIPDVMARKALIKYSKRQLDRLAAEAQRDFRDLPVWRQYVQRYGLNEARHMLRRGLLINQIPDGDPRN